MAKCIFANNNSNMFLHLTIANPFLIEINEEQRLVFLIWKVKI